MKNNNKRKFINATKNKFPPYLYLHYKCIRQRISQSLEHLGQGLEVREGGLDSRQWREILSLLHSVQRALVPTLPHTKWLSRPLSQK